MHVYRNPPLVEHVQLAKHMVTGRMSSRGKYSYYTVKFKLEVVRYALNHSKAEASRKFGVHKKLVQTWYQFEKRVYVRLCHSNILILGVSVWKVPLPTVYTYSIYLQYIPTVYTTVNCPSLARLVCVHVIVCTVYVKKNATNVPPRH